jgi:hypothetical protein
MKQDKHSSEYCESLAKRMRPSPATEENMTSETHTAYTELVRRASNTQPQAQQMSRQSYITIHNAIKEELKKGYYKVNIAPSDLVDFGGQRSFDMTHQLFIQRKGEFILMFNGKYDLREPLPEYPQGDVTTECKLLYICVLTFLIYILNNNIMFVVLSLSAVSESKLFCRLMSLFILSELEMFIFDLIYCV